MPLLSWFSVTTSLGSVCLTTVLVDTPCGLPLPSQRALNVIVLKPPSLSPHRPVAKRGSPPKVCDYNPLPGRQITCPSIPLPHHYHQYHVLQGLRRRGLHAKAFAACRLSRGRVGGLRVEVLQPPPLPICGHPRCCCQCGQSVRWCSRARSGLPCRTGSTSSAPADDTGPWGRGTSGTSRT